MEDRILFPDHYIYELCEEYPELIDVLEELGFSEITKKGALNTVGRFMTIPKAAAMQGLSLDWVADALHKRGFALADRPEAYADKEDTCTDITAGGTDAGIVPAGIGQETEATEKTSPAETSDEEGAGTADRPKTSAPEPSGCLTPVQLAALLENLPMALTFIDADGIVRYSNSGIQNGHPEAPEIPGSDSFSRLSEQDTQAVHTILNSLRQGTRNSAELWQRIESEPVLVRFVAVRDQAGQYLGTLKCMQPMGFAERHFRNENRG